MKQIYLLSIAAISALSLLSSCNKESQPVNDGEDELITFMPMLESKAKGEMIEGTTYDTTKAGCFYVKAYNKDNNTPTFDYTKVMLFKHETGSKHSYWSTVDSTGKIKEYFWKKSGDSAENKYFYAWANLPSTGASVTSKNWYSQNLQYNVYQIPNAANQKDILLGLGHGTGYTKTDYVGRFVQLTFGHPLTAIKFNIGEITGWQAGDKITEIKLAGVHSSGKYYNNDSGSSWTERSTNTTTVTMSNASGIDLSKEAFFLIPQETGKSITFTVTMTLGGVPQAAKSATITAGEWLPGNYYTYNFNINSSGEELSLSVSLDNWGKVEEDVDVVEGSVMTYGGTQVDTWGSQDNGNLTYSD